MYPRRNPRRLPGRDITCIECLKMSWNLPNKWNGEGGCTNQSSWLPVKMLILALWNRKTNSLKGYWKFTVLLGGMEYHILGNTARSTALNYVIELVQWGPHSHASQHHNSPHQPQSKSPHSFPLCFNSSWYQGQAKYPWLAEHGSLACPSCKGGWESRCWHSHTLFWGLNSLPTNTHGKGTQMLDGQRHVKCPLRGALEAKGTNRAKKGTESACLGSEQWDGHCAP